MFKDDDTIIYRRFENQKRNNVKCCIIFVEGMANYEIINENIILPIVNTHDFKSENTVFETLQNQVIVSSKIEPCSCVEELASSILNGDTLLLVDGSHILSALKVGKQEQLKSLKPKEPFVVQEKALQNLCI